MKRPRRFDRLPEQYFMRLLARVQAAAAAGGEPLVDLGRGNPDVPPPQHVIDALTASAAAPRAARGRGNRSSPPPQHVIDALTASANEHTAHVHGYAPFAGLPE